jgi:hypothetical protein
MIDFMKRSVGFQFTVMMVVLWGASTALLCYRSIPN